MLRECSATQQRFLTQFAAVSDWPLLAREWAQTGAPLRVNACSPGPGKGAGHWYCAGPAQARPLAS